MHPHFPMEFTLDSGTRVRITPAEDQSFHFTLLPEHGPERHFVYREGEHSKSEWDEIADFEQLEALRVFWLRTEEVL